MYEPRYGTQIGLMEVFRQCNPHQCRLNCLAYCFSALMRRYNFQCSKIKVSNSNGDDIGWNCEWEDLQMIGDDEKGSSWQLERGKAFAGIYSEW